MTPLRLVLRLPLRVWRWLEEPYPDEPGWPGVF